MFREGVQALTRMESVDREQICRLNGSTTDIILHSYDYTSRPGCCEVSETHFISQMVVACHWRGVMRHFCVSNDLHNVWSVHSSILSDIQLYYQFNIFTCTRNSTWRYSRISKDYKLYCVTLPPVTKLKLHRDWIQTFQVNVCQLNKLSDYRNPQQSFSFPSSISTKLLRKRRKKGDDFTRSHTEHIRRKVCLINKSWSEWHVMVNFSISWGYLQTSLMLFFVCLFEVMMRLMTS